LGYFRDLTNERQVAATAEKHVVRLMLSGTPPAIAVAQREAFRAYVRDRRALFDRTYRTFFFVDKHPEIADRFRMTYDLCFRIS
jgi:hypothetical protein